LSDLEASLSIILRKIVHRWTMICSHRGQSAIMISYCCTSYRLANSLGHIGLSRLSQQSQSIHILSVIQYSATIDSRYLVSLSSLDVGIKFINLRNIRVSGHRWIKVTNVLKFEWAA
jgi:hypothetical protein